MVEVRRHGERDGLVAALALFALLGSPARALAQAAGDAGTTTSSFPDDESAAPELTAEPPPNSSQEPSVTLPPADVAASPPPENVAAPLPPRNVAAPPTSAAPPAPSVPRFRVALSAEGSWVVIRGPGIVQPLRCSGTCIFTLREGTYWLDIQTSRRNWTMPLEVTGAQRVIIDRPDAGVRALGVAAIILGGSIMFYTASVAYLIFLNCGLEGSEQGVSEPCESDRDAFPQLLAATGIGAAVTALGIGVVVSNKPSLEVVPVLGRRARRSPETFIGLGLVGGTTLLGPSLRASF